MERLKSNIRIIKQKRPINNSPNNINNYLKLIKGGDKVKKIILVFTLLFIVGVCFSAFAADAKYVGVKKCKMCHSTSKSGAQYKIWGKGSHANAFKTLASDAAKKTAAKAGVKGDPQKAAECLACHTTAYDPTTGKKRGDTASTLTMEEGVSCESCHGPGSVYKSKKNMKDHKLYLKTGGIMPNKELCVKCHNPKSPTYKAFDYEKRKKEIAHPTPKK